MAQLKEHILREIAIDFCGRVQTDLNYLEKFVLAGKEPARVFRRIVACDITIIKVTPDVVLVKHRDNWWPHKRSFLNILLITWAKKACLQDFDWLYESLLSGYSKVMAQNTGVEELHIHCSGSSCNWLQILKTFPNVVVLKLPAKNFASMLSAAPTELICLQEVQLRGGINDLRAAHKALSVHQKKLPSLDTIHYVDTPLKDIAFPDDANNVLSVKHLKIGAAIRCCTPLDYSFLPAAQKMFPSLESVEIGANVNCFHFDHNATRKLEVAKSFYEAFESLSFGFSINITYADHFLSFKKDLTKLRQFFATKGKIYGSPEKFDVETSVPGKRFTYKATVTAHSDLLFYSAEYYYMF